MSARETEYQRLYEDIRNASRLLARARGGRKTAGVPETQARLVPRGGLVLSYLVDEDQVRLFVVPATGRGEVVRLVVADDAASDLGVEPGPLRAAGLRRILAPESLDPQAPVGLLGRLGRRPVTVGSRRDVEPVLHALWRVLLPEAVWSRVQAGTEVVIIPDGILHRLPFEALVVSRGSDGARFWIDEHGGPPVRYAASATALLALGGRPLQSVNRRLVSVADPAGSLPGTAREAEAVGAAFRARGLDGLVTSLVGPEAREPRVRDAVQQGRHLHLATHGLVDENRSELFASLALAAPAGPARPEDDGLLQLHEIYDLRLDADLAVLSACASRVGEVLAGEGPLALSRAFLAAGSRRVVASLWSVEDAATAHLFAEFFREVARGEATKTPVDYTGALARAKQKVRGRPEWADPFFWAAFVLEGAPSGPGNGSASARRGP